MSVTSQINRIREQGNGSKTAFDFSFPIFSATDLQVYKVVRATDIETLQTITTDYSVSINTSTEGGTVTYVTAPTSLQDSLIVRVLDFTQGAVLPTEGNFREDQVEDQLDRAVMRDIQLQEQIDRCVQVGIAEDSISVEELTDAVADAEASATAAAASAAAASSSASDASASAAAAAASASSVNLPSLSGQAGKVLQVKSDETGYELTAGNAASRPVILDASSRLPAVDGSQLTGLGWVDRGDPSSVDFSSFTNDGTWRDLDLSSIVPAGAKAAMLRLVGQATTNDKLFSVRKNGNSNSLNVGGIWLVAANVNHVADVIVTLDSNRIVEYAGTSATWSNQTITVKGWFI